MKLFKFCIAFLVLFMASGCEKEFHFTTPAKDNRVNTNSITIRMLSCDFTYRQSATDAAGNSVTFFKWNCPAGFH